MFGWKFVFYCTEKPVWVEEVDWGFVSQLDFGSTDIDTRFASCASISPDIITIPQLVCAVSLTQTDAKGSALKTQLVSKVSDFPTTAVNSHHACTYCDYKLPIYKLCVVYCADVDYCIRIWYLILRYVPIIYWCRCGTQRISTHTYTPSHTRTWEPHTSRTSERHGRTAGEHALMSKNLVGLWQNKNA